MIEETEDCVHRMSELLGRVAETVLALGPDAYENIGRLTRLCGELLQADAAVYYRRQGDTLFAVGRWELPASFDVVLAGDRACPDPERLAASGFRGSVGRDAAADGAVEGRLCALYLAPRRPGPLDESILKLAAGAIAVEERRLRAELERRRLAEELRQASKMEAIGQLVGGIAHDFNNSLTSICGNAEILRARTDLAPEAREGIEEVSRAGRYASSLTRQLLAFSRKQVLDPVVFDLNTTVVELSKMLKRVVGEHIALELEPDPSLDCVRADVGQIEQVVMNLALNARDAMPQGGRLTIRTRALMLAGDALPAALKERPGRYVVLSVSDTGAGMTREVKARLFEPFFTTKEVGKGTGLGLSTVYGIVHQSEGAIGVDSEPGKGSEFRVYLPAVAGAAPAPARAAAPAEGGAGCAVLLVEDEAPVRTIVGRVLAAASFRMSEANGGAQALRLIEAGAACDVLITDIVMPEMSGFELAQKVRARRPDVPVLFMSGYSDEETLKSVAACPNSGVLMKPFSPSELVRRVRRTLAAASSAAPKAR